MSGDPTAASAPAAAPLMGPLPLFVEADAAAAQAEGTTSHVIGSIPSTVFAEGSPVRFNVLPPQGVAGPVSVSNASPGYGSPVITTDPQGVQTFSYSLPVIGSTLTFTFNPATGEFGYTPDADDRFDFTLQFAAPGSDGIGLPIAQQVKVLPRAARHEHDLVSSTTETTPNPESLDYVSVTVRPGSTHERFNASASPVTTRNVEIVGKSIVFGPNQPNGLYESFAHTGGSSSRDIENITIYAERLVIRGNVRLPQTNVTVYARELEFDDAVGAAKLDTTPLDYGTQRAAQFIRGIDGHKAGDLTLNVGIVKVPSSSTTPRFILRGGTGQGGGVGRDGVNQPHVWDLTENPAYRWDSSWQNFIGSRDISYWRHIGNSIYVPTNTTPGDPNFYVGFWRNEDFPKDGGPATAGGAPGTGGRGGTFRVTGTSSASLATLVDISGGSPGERAPDARGGAAGTPRRAVIFERYAHPSGRNFGPNGNGFASREIVRHSVDGIDAFGPHGFHGSDGHITQGEASVAWLNPSVVRPMLSYVKDAYLAGNVDYARDASQTLHDLLDANATSTSGPEFDDIRSELHVMKQRAEAALDYFGNPAGWTPMLSFVSNLAAYKDEIDSAVRVKFLAALVERAAAKNQNVVDELGKMMSQLDAEMTRATAELDLHQTLLPRLEQQVATITARTEVFQQTLAFREQQLIRQAQTDVEAKNKPPTWKRVLGILGTIAKVVPVGQPLLGAVGTGLTTIANLSSKPLEAITEVKGVVDVFKNSAKIMKDTRDGFAALGKTLKPPTSASAPELQGYVKTLGDYGKQWGGALKDINAAMQPYTAPKDAVEAELAKIRASDPVFNDLVDEITELNALKEVFARDLANSLKVVGDSLTAITTNQQAALSINRNRSDAIGRLDRETAEQVKQMARRADERLLRYQYYMAKAYEYETLKPYTGSFRMEALTNRITNVLSGGAGATWLDNPPAAGDPIGADILKTVYENALREIANSILTDKNTLANNRRFTAQGFFRLEPAELDRLDAEGEVTINLVERGDIAPNRQDAIKLLQITADQIQAASGGGGPGGSAEVQLEFLHGGTSLLRDDGRTFQFRHHRGGSIDDLVQEAPIRLGTTRKNVGFDLPATHDTADLQQLALLSYLLPGVPANNEVLYAQPGAWGDVRIRKTTMTQGATVDLQQVLFKVQYSYEAAANDKATLVVRKQADGLTPAVAVSAGGTGVVADASGRSDGLGAFHRTYPTDTQLTLTAEPYYGGLKFDKWLDAQNQVIGNQPTLTRTLSSAGLSIRPAYAAVPAVTAVYVRGSTWTSAFKAHVEGKALGDDVLGYRVDTLTGDAATLPWTNADEVVLRFSAPPAAGGVPQPGAVLDGVRGDYAVASVAQIDPQTFALRLNQPLGTLSAAGDNGDRVGLTVPAAGPAGGDYNLTLSALPGDTDRSGVVVASDYSDVKKRFFKSTTSPVLDNGADYSIFHDVDGNGVIIANDYAEVKKRFFTRLPATPAAALPAFSQSTVADNSGATAALPTRRDVLESSPDLLA